MRPIQLRVIEVHPRNRGGRPYWTLHHRLAAQRETPRGSKTSPVPTSRSRPAPSTRSARQRRRSRGGQPDGGRQLRVRLNSQGLATDLPADGLEYALGDGPETGHGLGRGRILEDWLCAGGWTGTRLEQWSSVRRGRAPMIRTTTGSLRSSLSRTALARSEDLDFSDPHETPSASRATAEPRVIEAKVDCPDKPVRSITGPQLHARESPRTLCIPIAYRSPVRRQPQKEACDSASAIAGRQVHSRDSA